MTRVMRPEIAFEHGVSYSTRAQWSNNAHVPTASNQIPGFHIGIVMDDHDDLFNGRVWVFIVTQPAGQTGDWLPSGANPQRDKTNWILCSPMFPHSGADSFRQGAVDPQQSDSRNARIGQSNSYGDWYHPRIGDYVGILFAGGDPNHSYWIGCVPKPGQNFMMPGHAGIPTDVSNTGNTRVAYNPVHEQAKTDQSPRKLSQAFNASLVNSGLQYDLQRGAGTSSAQRESPSYVRGIKSAGWNWGTEFNQVNANAPNGKTFADNPEFYKSYNSMGHQIVLDDHPDFQSVRIRTSLGAQVLFNDSQQYIYMNTARGNTWLEMNDNGSLHIFTTDNISVHSGGNINYTCDGNFNLEVMGNYNLYVHGNSYMDLRGTTSIIAGALATGATAIPNGLSIHTYGTVDITSEKFWHHTCLGEYSLKTDGDLHIDSTSKISIIAGDELYLVGNGVETYSVNEDIIIYSAANTWIDAAQMVNIKTSGYNLVTAPKGIDAVPNFIIKLGNTYTAPTAAQVAAGTIPDTAPYLAPIVPQHEPWPGHPALTTKIRGKYNGDAVSTIPIGAIDPGAKKAINYVGNGPQGPGIYQAAAYRTSSTNETPIFSKIAPVQDGTLNPASAYTSSAALIEFIKQHEWFMPYPYEDPGIKKWAIGYGHNIYVGDVIGGITVTQTILNQIDAAAASGPNPKQASVGSPLIITEPQATDLLKADLVKFEAVVKQYVKVLITQGQFDALVDLTFNTGNPFVGTRSGGQTRLIQKLNSGDYAGAAQEFQGWCHDTYGREVESLKRIRRNEIVLFWCAGASPDQTSAATVQA